MNAPLCINCGKKLRRCNLRHYMPDKQWGDYGDGHFCGLRCGYKWSLMYMERYPEHAANLHKAMIEVMGKKKEQP